MKRNQKEQLLSLVEGAIMVALAVVLDLLCKFIPDKALFPFGGGITIGFLPLVYYTFRRGTAWGLGAGLVYSAVQLVTGWYPPPAGTATAFIACVLLDYLIAFSAVGLASVMAKPFGKNRLIGYGIGCFGVHILRFFCSFFSGVYLWNSTIPDEFNHMGPWLYSLVYNGSYMGVNAVLCTILTVLLCVAVDPQTLKRMKKK